MTSKVPASKQLFRSAAGFVLVAFLLAFAPLPCRGQLSTDDHLSEPGWWPRRKPANLNEFAGNAACAKCHSRIAASQKTTAMARTLMRAADAEVLHSHSDLAFRNGKYLYQIKPKGTASQLTVTDGERALAADLVWAFGSGSLGQSYLFSRTGLTAKAA